MCVGPLLGAVAACLVGLASAQDRAARLERAESARFENRVDEARRLFRALLADEPEYVAAHLAYQKLRLSVDDRSVVERTYAARLEKARTALNCLLCARLEAKPKAAEALYREALEQSPGDARLRLGLGRSLARQRRVDAALVEFDRAAGLAPARLDAHYELINLLRQSGRAGELIERYRVPEDTDDWRRILLYGVALAANRRFENAERWMRRAAGIDPDNAAILEARATLLALQSNVKRAAALLAKARAPYSRAARWET